MAILNPDAILERAGSQILDRATASLKHAHDAHYEAAGEQFARDRLEDLFDLVVAAIASRDLTQVVGYCEQVARERFSSGFDVGEVQDAINALESAMWRELVANEPPEDLAQGIGLLSTVLGAGKDALARTYVSLASKRHVTSLDLTALFKGTGS